MGRKKTVEVPAPGAKILAGHPLFDLVEDAYRVFETYKPGEVDVCTCGCCMSEATAADFFRPDIENLPLAYLEEWFSAAYATAGVTKQVWTYLLPRILEVLSAGQSPSPLGIELALDRFDTGNSAHWSNAQWEVLDAFQRRYLASGLSGSWGGTFEDVLCMFNSGGWELTRLLAEAEQLPDPYLAQVMWRTWCYEDWAPMKIELSPFWEKPDRAQVFEFFTSDALWGRMVALALNDEIDPGIATKASALVDAIEASR